MGAYVLTSVPGNRLKPLVAVYLLLVGGRLLFKAWQQSSFKFTLKRLFPLALLAGFCDAVGGGGWGPIVTGTLLVRGYIPHKVIGTVNTSEFFVTVTQTATFIALMGFGNWKLISGLIIGGILAAPLAAYLCKRINQKILMSAVGILIIIINGYILFNWWQ